MAQKWLDYLATLPKELADDLDAAVKGFMRYDKARRGGTPWPPPGFMPALRRAARAAGQLHGAVKEFRRVDRRTWGAARANIELHNASGDVCSVLTDLREEFSTYVGIDVRPAHWPKRGDRRIAGRIVRRAAARVALWAGKTLDALYAVDDTLGDDSENGSEYASDRIASDVFGVREVDLDDALARLPGVLRVTAILNSRAQGAQLDGPERFLLRRVTEALVRHRIETDPSMKSDGALVLWNVFYIGGKPFDRARFRQALAVIAELEAHSRKTTLSKK